ncbi:MAG: PAS domain S-box protein, partial [Chloroflexaceae bacterium]|nr:PAS domain S-box protein [Chloroflexaceae bacterium]
MTSDKTELMQLHQRIAELEAQLHERNRFVQHLEQQQVRYRTMLQALPDTVFLLHPEGRVLDYYVTNDDTWLQLGEHVIGQPIQQLLPDWLADLTLQSLHQARDTGSHTVQYTLSRADQCFSFEARSVLVNDHEVLVIVRDITDQQHVRIALEQSEERFRLVFEHTPIGMCITNEQGLFEYVNPAYCQLYAYAPDELIGQPFTIVVPEGQRDVLWELHRQFITGETEEIGSDWQVVNRHGACLTILADAARIMGHDGRPRKATFVRNITEERATRERLTLMDAAVHYSTECILITDNGIDFPGPRIVFVNPAFTRLTGYQPEEVIGKTPRMLQGARTDRTMLQQLRQSLEQGQPFGAETTNYRKDGSEYVVEWRISPIRNASGEVTNWVSVQRDRTEQKQAEQELQLAKVSAEAANRSKSMFLAQMSHELRTPLNAILGFVQLLLRDKRLSADQHEHLDIIGRSGEHLLDLINQVLEISKIEAGRMTLNEVGFDLHRMLNWLEEMFQVRAQQKGLSLNLRRAESVPQYVYGDESKLRQVLINLLGNAIKFTETGSITLRVTAQDTYRPQGTTDDAAIPVRLWFQVRDTGRGIAPDELDLLFKAFSQTRTGQTSMEGSGLGLTISREFVRLMRGDILITSEVDIGTTVTFDIPLAVTDASLVKPAEQT